MNVRVADQSSDRDNSGSITFASAENDYAVKLTENRLLIVHGDVAMTERLRESLPAYGFDSTVVHTAAAGWKALESGAFNLILLDVVLPDGSEAGFELAQKARDVGWHQPILFLSTRNSLADRVRGLKYGDDYLSTFFELPELVARLEALSRRGAPSPKLVRWGEVEMLREGRQVYRNGTLVSLTAKEHKVLEFFMLHPDRIFSRSEILENVWGVGYSSRSNMIDVYIKKIRTKLGKAVIETVRGLGYRFHS